MVLAQLLGHWFESLDYSYNISSHCSRHVSPRSTCTACIDSCPVDAIKLENGKPVIDTKSCIECGDCVASCPVQAVEGFLPKWKIQNECLFMEEDRIPSVKELLVYHKSGITTLVSENDAIHPDWQETIDSANQMLDKLGESPFQISFDQIVSSDDNKLSRRELFSLWDTELKKIGKDMTPAKWRFNHESLNLSQKYPGYQFTEISLNTTTCTVCGACEKLCPQACLIIDQDHFSISAEQCTNCSLCQDICPEGAISLKQMITPATTVDHQVYDNECASCHETFKTLDSDNDECMFCKIRQNSYV